ncbi:MAG: peptide-methionine (S)-S-oxide reductase MsrA [Paracoccaceae bacterium]
MTFAINMKTALLSVSIVMGMIAQTKPTLAAETATLTVAGGCFWCVEADFEKVKGVKDVISGFTGGSVPNATYKQVSSGGTGHYEAVQIKYDPGVISAGQLYGMFFRSIDPTDAGGQFCDRGASYRTAIFAGPDELDAAKKAKAAAQSELGQKLVTPILTEGQFFPANAYHQDYYKQSKVILTRFGPLSKAKAYKKYRAACGRDARVKELWGSAAPFAGS